MAGGISERRHSGCLSFDWFNWYLCTGEHVQSDLDIFRFDFMLMKPLDVPPHFTLTCQLMWDFYYNSSCFQGIGIVKRSCCNKNLMSVCMSKQSSGGTSCGSTNMKLNQNMSRSDWKCSQIHKYWLISQTEHCARIRRGTLCFFPRGWTGYPAWLHWSLRYPWCWVQVIRKSIIGLIGLYSHSNTLPVVAC